MTSSSTPTISSFHNNINPLPPWTSTTLTSAPWPTVAQHPYNFSSCSSKEHYASSSSLGQTTYVGSKKARPPVPAVSCPTPFFLPSNDNIVGSTSSGSVEHKQQGSSSQPGQPPPRAFKNATSNVTTCPGKSLAPSFLLFFLLLFLHARHELIHVLLLAAFTSNWVKWAGHLAQFTGLD